MKRSKGAPLVFILIAGIIMQSQFGFSEDIDPEELVVMQLRGGQSSLELYYTHYKYYPEDLLTLIQEGYMAEIGNIDPWGNEFYYEKLEGIGGNYSLGSAGPDKEFWTEDDIDGPINPKRHTLKVSSLYTFAKNKFYTELENIEKEAFRSFDQDITAFFNNKESFEETALLMKNLITFYGKNPGAWKKIIEKIVKERKTAAKTYISDYEEFCNMFKKARKKDFNIEKDLVRTEKLLNADSVKKEFQAIRENKSKENLTGLRQMLQMCLAKGWEGDKDFIIPEQLDKELSRFNWVIPKEEITSCGNVSVIFDGKGGWWYNREKTLVLYKQGLKFAVKRRNENSEEDVVSTPEEVKFYNEFRENIRSCILINLNGKDSKGKEYNKY